MCPLITWWFQIKWNAHLLPCYSCDLLERPDLEQPAHITAEGISLSFTPFQIVSLLLILWKKLQTSGHSYAEIHRADRAWKLQKMFTAVLIFTWIKNWSIFYVKNVFNGRKGPVIICHSVLLLSHSVSVDLQQGQWKLFFFFFKFPPKNW